MKQELPITPPQKVDREIQDFFAATSTSMCGFLSKLAAPLEVHWLCEGYKNFMKEYETAVKQHLRLTRSQEMTLPILNEFEEWSQRVYYIQATARGENVPPPKQQHAQCFNFLQNQMSFEKLKEIKIDLKDLHQLKISFELKKMDKAPACCKFKTLAVTYTRLDVLRAFCNYCRDNSDQIFKSKVFPNESPLSQQIRLYQKYLAVL